MPCTVSTLYSTVPIQPYIVHCTVYKVQYKSLAERVLLCFGSRLRFKCKQSLTDINSDLLKKRNLAVLLTILMTKS